jgi:single-stranded-DNA-specific exonuclease
MPDEAIYYVDFIYHNTDIKSDLILSIADMDDLWGKDIDEPLICLEGVNVSSDMVTVYQKRDNTLKITLPNKINLIKFKATDEECYKLQNHGFGYIELNVIGKCSKNEWMGNITPQILIEDY